MKVKYILGAALLSTAGLSSCIQEFADVNTNPSIVTTPDIKYLFTQGLDEFVPSDYYSWFYDFTNMLHWGQVTVSGNTNLLNQPAIASGLGNVVRVMKLMREIDFQISQMEPEKAVQYKYIQTMMKPLVVFMGIQDTDMYGSMPYSEAAMARYTTPPLLTPKYDTQKELFESFDKDLSDAFKVLTNPVVVDGRNISQVSLGNQDFVFKGDVKKWATFCNSLRLKVAVRLLHVDKDKALAIANEVASNSEYLLTENGNECANNFIYNQGTEWYHTQEDPYPGNGTKILLDFLVKNKDPRVRFFFAKNDFNSKVVQAFFDSEFELKDKCESKIPDFIMENIEYETDAEGKKIFKNWKNGGEPWVRYYGMPLTINASNDEQWKEYYDPEGKLHKVKLNDKELTYTPVSALQLEMYKGDIDYTFPDAPGVQIEQDKTDQPFYAMYFSAGEVNLYLAELKLLGATLPKTASEYFTAGIKNSVEAWDYVAGKNRIPYYHKKYDNNEETIELRDGEVAGLLTKEAYKLDGTNDLEKVYIQQHLNFIFMPNDMYVSMRRSGVPMKNSSYLPFENFMKDGSKYVLPRRCPFVAGSPTDMMYEIYTKALSEQGFSIGSDANALNSERVWYDKGAPDFGEGPNL